MWQILRRVSWLFSFHNFSPNEENNTLATQMFPSHNSCGVILQLKCLCSCWKHLDLGSSDSPCASSSQMFHSNRPSISWRRWFRLCLMSAEWWSCQDNGCRPLLAYGYMEKQLWWFTWKSEPKDCPCLLAMQSKAELQRTTFVFSFSWHCCCS